MRMSLPTVLRAFIDGTAAAAVLRPWLDLAIRLWLAQAFLAFQVHEMMSAVPSGSDHPAAGLLQAVMTSHPGMIVQALCPGLLAFGLFARPAAAAMLLQALLMPSEGDSGLFWAALLLRVIILGAGAFSIDQVLQRGAESLALPGATGVHDGFLWVRRMLGPVYLLGLRLWLAAAPAGLALSALAVTPSMRPAVAFWLPHVPSMIAALAPELALLAAVLLACGAATRLTAIGLLLLVPLSQLTPGDERLYWVLLLAVLALHGAGPYAIDAWLAARLRRIVPPVNLAALPHVVIVGGGFGGVAAVRGLRDAPCRITLIDRRNYHLFQPLLYQVATASLSPADIATPVRGLFRNQPNVKVLLGHVTGVDTQAKTVLLEHQVIHYDHLVLATGAQHSYFGHDEWAVFAPGLKTVEDSTAIRRRLLLAFEEAEGAQSDADRDAWLTFVIVGGGPTGVELAGAIAELARHGMEQEFRAIDPTRARVILVQSGPRLLPSFPQTLSREAERALTQLGVEVVLDRAVEAVSDTSVTIAGEELPTRTVLWAAGVMASPAAAWLGVQPDRAGRVPVDTALKVPGLDNVYAIGDTAASAGWRGQPVPGLAPAAKQGGAYVARVIKAQLNGRTVPGPFCYRHLGSLATIGRRAAVADFGFIRLRGALAWWMWGAAHLAFLVGGQNRITVLVQWLWAYVTFRRGPRLITDSR